MKSRHKFVSSQQTFVNKFSHFKLIISKTIKETLPVNGLLDV